jgi:CubicO group peptidase (beta-lactamase class C family)
MVLVERGKLDLDDPIARHLPSPARWGSITVRHLLTHTSGLPDDELVLNLRRDYTENELALFTASLPRRYRPGKHFQYSNLGYALLGMIIRRVSGQFYGDFLRENIFIPAGMHTTRIISEADIVPRRGRVSTVAKPNKESGVGCAESQHDGGWGTPRDASRSYRLGAGGSYSSTPQRRELVENLSARDAFKRSEKLVWICMGVGATVEKIFIIMTALGKDLKRC